MRTEPLLLFLILLIHAPTFCQVEPNKDRFEHVDQHVSSVNRQAVFHPELLAKLLAEGLTNDYDKVRSFYIWIASNIKYDMHAYTYDRSGGQSVNQVLRSGKALCSGYSLLFNYFCDQANITSEILEGYAKGYGYRKKQRFKKSNHAWNAVNIYGRWYLLDATWASGSPINPDRKKSKEEVESWFLTDPAQFALTHLPEDPSWQLLDHKVTLSAFETGEIESNDDSLQINAYSPFDYTNLNEYDHDLLKYKRAVAFNAANSQLKEQLSFAYIYKGISITDDLWQMDYRQLKDTIPYLETQFYSQMESAWRIVESNEKHFTIRERQIITDEINYQKGVFNYEIGAELFRKSRQSREGRMAALSSTQAHFSTAESHFELVPQTSIYRRDADEYLENIGEFRSRNPYDLRSD